MEHKEAIGVIEARIKQLEKPVYDKRWKKAVITSLQKSISLLKNTKVVASGVVTGIMIECKNKKCTRFVHTDKLGDVSIGEYEGDPIGKHISISITREEV